MLKYMVIKFYREYKAQGLVETSLIYLFVAVALIITLVFFKSELIKYYEYIVLGI